MHARALSFSSCFVLLWAVLISGCHPFEEVEEYNFSDATPDVFEDLSPSDSADTTPPDDGDTGADLLDGETSSGGGDVEVTPPPGCGDGQVDVGEGCDDGDVSAGDGCAADCQVELNWSCDGEPSSCTQTCFDEDGDGYGEGPSCAGPDCRDDVLEIHPDAPEVCNGVDDDCDEDVDEGTDVECYEGADGTQGVGRCVGGMRYCNDGQLGPCLGQVLPTPEACNNLDDDCDGTPDDNLATVSCGVGACAALVSTCSAGGVGVSCPLPPISSETCFDGIDNDCDGGIDEGCDCVYVAPNGDDANMGTQTAPMRSINAAIQRAAQASTPDQVCVASRDGSCSGGGDWISYTEDLLLVNGVSLYGGFEPNNWTRPNCHTTNIRSSVPQGLYFGPDITDPTVIDGFEIELVLDVDKYVSVVTIDGAAGAILSNNHIIGPPQGAITVEESRGVHIKNGATALLYDNAIQGGHGTLLTVGVHVESASAQLLKQCSAGDLDSAGRCTSGCGPLAWGGKHIMAHRTTFPNPLPSFERGYGVLLEDAAGTLIDQTEMCGTGNLEAAGVKIIGDADGVVIARSRAGSWGAALGNGIRLEDCGGASPWIGDNSSLWADGDNSGTAITEGVGSFGDCHPLIERNVLITGGFEGSSDNTHGVHCGAHNGTPSLCAIVGNNEIRGSSNGFPVRSTGVKCSNSACSLIRDNAWIHGRGGIEVRGLELERSSSVLVERNIIEGGCPTSIAVAVHAQSAGARLQNNVIWAGACANGTPTSGLQYIGLLSLQGAGPAELDAHSNMIHGGSDPTTCESTGVALDIDSGAPATSPRGLFRNNIIDGGQCATSLAVHELAADADPRVFEHNALLWPNRTPGLYKDEARETLLSADEVNALTDVFVQNNLDDDPLLNGSFYGQFIPLSANSPCRNSGTSTGAPAEDFEGDARPADGLFDVGPDEVMP